MYTIYNIKIYKPYDIYISHLYYPSITFFNIYKNYETQIIKYKGFANIHEMYMKCKL